VLSYIADLKNYIIHQPVASKDDLKWVSVNDRMPDIEDYNYMEIDGKIKICSDNFALVVVSMDNESSGRMGYDISAGELCTDCEGKPYFKILDPELRDSYRVVGWMHLPEVNVEKLMGIEN
jgi:hypothetical protein